MAGASADEPSAELAAFFDALSSEVTEQGYAIRDGVSALSGVSPMVCRAEAEEKREAMSFATISTGVKVRTRRQLASGWAEWTKDHCICRALS